MRDLTKTLALIENCKDPEMLRSWITNARRIGEDQVADAAFRKLVSILPKYQPGTVEHELWQTIHAFELVLSDERGKTIQLSRTRQKIGRVGEIQTLKDWALSAKRTEGFDMLLKRGMPELTGEAIVLRYAGRFDSDVVSAARARLEEAGVEIDSITRPRGPQA